MALSFQVTETRFYSVEKLIDWQFTDDFDIFFSYSFQTYLVPFIEKGIFCLLRMVTVF